MIILIHMVRMIRDHLFDLLYCVNGRERVFECLLQNDMELMEKDCALRQSESHSFQVDARGYHDLIQQCRLSVPEERPFIASVLASLMDMNSS
jgi:hypothetical protein